MSSSSSQSPRGPVLAFALLLLAAAAAGAWANIHRVAAWTTVAVFDPAATSFALPTPGARHQREAGTYARLTLRLPDWRPLDLRVALRLQGAPADGAEVRIIAGGGTGGDRAADSARLRVSGTWQKTSVLLTMAPAVARQVALSVEADPAQARAIAIGAIEARPIYTPLALLRHGLAGALTGLLLALLCRPRVWRWMTRPARLPQSGDPRRLGDTGEPAERIERSERVEHRERSERNERDERHERHESDRREDSGDRAADDHAAGDRAAADRAAAARTSARSSWRTLAAIGAAAFFWFALWSLVKPIMQAPDEPQHLMRAGAVARVPWIARDIAIDPDPQRVNALAYDHPLALWQIIPRATRPLTAPDLAAFKQVSWGQAGSHLPVQPFRVAIASYPPLYYWTAFAIAEPVTRLLALSPYQSVWAYRLATAAIGAVLWVIVFAALRRLPETRALAPALLAFLLLQPMVGYLSGAVHTDSPAIALGTLALLLAWRTLRTGEAAGWTFAALLAGLLIKPSGLMVAGSIASAAALVWLTGRTRTHTRTHAGASVSGRDTARVLLAAAGAIALSYGAFYAWSPPVLFGEPRITSLAGYLADLGGRIVALWTGAWGMLGWMDLSLAPAWYGGIALLLLASGLCAWKAPLPPQLLLPPSPSPSPSTSPSPSPPSSSGLSQPLQSRADDAAVAAAAAIPATTASPDARGFTLFFAAAGLAFTIATLAGEQRYAAESGYFLQGRYFLPALAALLPALRHRVRALWGVLLLYLLVMNLLLMRLNVLRCYGDWHTFWQSLPFVS